MPETAEQTTDYGFENGFGNYEFERPLEVANENEPASAELATDQTTSEDLDDGRGGADERVVEYANDNAYKFTGEALIQPDGTSFTEQIKASGDPEAIALHDEMIRQWNEAQALKLEARQEFSNPDTVIKDADGETIYKTNMWLNPDGSVGFEITSLRIAANDNEMEQSRELTWDTASNLIAEIPTFNDERVLENPEEVLMYMEHAAAVEIGEPESAEDEAVAIGEAQQTIIANTEFVEAAQEEITPTAERADYSLADIYVPREVPSYEFNTFLAMEQLPAVNLEISDEPIILKAPEGMPFVPAQSVDTFEAREAAIEFVQPADEAKSHIFTAPIEAQHQVAPEIQQNTAQAEMARVDTAPVEVRQRKLEISNLPVAEMKDTAKAEVPVVETKEVRIQEPRVEKAKPVEEFRGRRGRTRYDAPSPYAARHDNDNEEVRDERRSDEKSTKVDMSERFTPEVQSERAEQKEEIYREPVVEAVAIVKRTEELSVPVVQEQLTNVILESAPLRTEGDRMNVVPFPQFATAERARPAEIEAILEQFRFPRAVETAEVMRAANENLPSIPGSRAYLADTSDRADDIVTTRDGIIMRRRKIAA